MSNEDLATGLSNRSFMERMKIIRAARLLRRYAKLVEEKLSKEEELEDAVAEFEETDE